MDALSQPESARDAIMLQLVVLLNTHGFGTGQKHGPFDAAAINNAADAIFTITDPDALAARIADCVGAMLVWPDATNDISLADFLAEGRLADEDLLGRASVVAARAVAGEGKPGRFISQEAAARFVERFAQRLADGPAIKEQSTPINRNRYSGDEVATIVPLLNALASGLRAGLTPERDWPNEPRLRIGDGVSPGGVPATIAVTNDRGFEISTGDPTFDPEGAVIVNGYRFERAPTLPPMAMTINPSEA